MKRSAGRAPRRDRRAPVVLTIGVVGVLLLTALYLALIGGGTRLVRDGLGGPFALVQGDGRAVTDRDFAGKTLIIYFGYTSCRDVCPTTLHTLAEAMDRLGPTARRVQPLFITVDPIRDTPEVVRRYVGAFMPELIGLTGTAEQLRRVAREYRVTSVIHPAREGGTYDVDHSSVLYLVDRNGMVVPIRADDSAEELATAIGRYLS